jgi:hypothetical protein
LKAKPGKEEEVATFLAGAQSSSPRRLERLPGMPSGSISGRLESLTASAATEARQAHLQGAVAAALLGRAEELLDGRPDIRPVDVLAEKLPA